MKLCKLLIGLFFCCLMPDSTTADEIAERAFAVQRQNMVQEQLRGRDITDGEVLRAMRTVPRHRFVPERLRQLAYLDMALPIEHAQTISQPYIVALMTQLLKVADGRRVLEVGTGSGYQAAVLAEMGVQVFTIEIIDELGRAAQTRLKELNYNGIQVKIGDGYLGWSEQAPFDAIIVTCAPTRVPEPLQHQLAEGGRMVIPVGDGKFQQLYLLTKRAGRLQRESIVDVRFVPMVDEGGKVR